MMATLKYSPKGTHGYLCELVSADGLVVQLANDANGVVVDGDAAATTNPTLVGRLNAFGSNEHAFRRSRNKERRELFAGRMFGQKHLNPRAVKFSRTILRRR